MNTNQLIEALEKMRDIYKLEKHDEDIIKVAIHRLKQYKFLIKKEADGK